MHILRGNLFQLAVTLPVVRAVIQGPAIRRWVKEHGVVDSLGPGRRTRGKQENTHQQPGSHADLSGEGDFECDADVRQVSCRHAYLQTLLVLLPSQLVMISQ